MTRQRQSSRGRFAVLLALLCVLGGAAQAAEYLQRLSILFYASFDIAGAPNGTISAEIGQFNPSLPPPTFTVVPGGNGKQLLISDSGTQTASELDGIFKKAFDGAVLIATYGFQALQYDSGLVVQLEDSTDQGILDCNWDGGTVKVNGAQTGIQYDAMSTYDVTTRLTKPSVGPWAWTLELRENGVLTGVASGVVTPAGPMSIKSINLIRAAGEPAGTFYVDEMKVSSLDMLPY
jgi:hypothetical protein